jgi:pyridoxamine 5'-phosphate oxidase-like protein
MSDPEGMDPEAEALLAKARRVFLFTLRADGSPTAHPMTGVFASRRLAFSTYRKAVKTRNAARDPRTCSLVLENYAGAGQRAVVYRGRAQLLEGEEALHAFSGGGGSAAGPVSSGISSRASNRLAQGKRVMLQIEPEEVELLRAPGS